MIGRTIVWGYSEKEVARFATIKAVKESGYPYDIVEANGFIGYNIACLKKVIHQYTIDTTDFSGVSQLVRF